MIFDAAMYLIAFATMRPREYKADPPRIAVVAVAAKRVQDKLLPRWLHAPEQFAGALASAVIHESGLDAAVHSGENHGNGHCLTQIHHTNGLWPRVGAPSYDALMGTDLQATTWCLETGALTLVLGSRKCHRDHFYTYWQKAMWTMYASGHRCAHPWSKQSSERSRVQNKIAFIGWQPSPEHRRLVQAVLDAEELSTR